MTRILALFTVAGLAFAQAQKQPTAEETADFIIGKLHGTRQNRVMPDKTAHDIRHSLKYAGACKFTLVNEVTAFLKSGPITISFETTVVDMKYFERTTLIPWVDRVGTVLTLIFNRHLDTVSTDPDTKASDTFYTESLDFRLSDDKLAERLTKALMHLGKVCGNDKPEPF